MPPNKSKTIFLAAHYPSKEAKSKAAQLAQVLTFKNQIEYEGRQLQEKDAQKLFKMADRFYEWALNQLSL